MALAAAVVISALGLLASHVDVDVDGTVARYTPSAVFLSAAGLGLAAHVTFNGFSRPTGVPPLTCTFLPDQDRQGTTRAPARDRSAAQWRPAPPRQYGRSRVGGGGGRAGIQQF